MAKRITVLLSDDNLKKLYSKQAAEIKKSSKSVSFSKIVNDTLRKSL
ncbi:hypothetical protein [Candidatus Nitrosopumilus sediminis]|nr:hypothetical protein [Candidatus Nitrosopumilus sediminis]